MADISFDFTEISKLAADLAKVPDAAGVNVRKALQVSAHRVKEAWRAKLAGGDTLGGAARSIAYELRGGNAIRGNSITAEIKPRLGGQGSLVWVPEFGSLSTAPRGFGRASLAENEENFVRGMQLAADDALKAAGL